MPADLYNGHSVSKVCGMISFDTYHDIPGMKDTIPILYNKFIDQSPIHPAFPGSPLNKKRDRERGV